MRKNGFTLVEMMTVIIIMVTLGIIAVFSITGIVKNSTEKLYQLQITSILDASRTYAVENANTLSDNNQITLCDLKRSSLLEDDLKNPRTEEPFDNSLIVDISKNSDGEFEFKFDGESKMENYYCDLDISVAINGDSPMYVKLGENFDEQGIVVKRNDLVCTKRVGNAVSNAANCYYDLTIAGDYTTALSSNKYSKVGTFKETYAVKDDKFSSTMTRTIVVQDKTPPQIYVSHKGTTYNKPFSVRVVEGETASFNCSASDNFSTNVNCIKTKDEYNGTTSPGTYEIAYTATDSSGNSSTMLVTVTVLAKNKNLIVGVNVDKVDWTSENVTLEIVPLYSSENCGGYLYTTDGGNFWNDTTTKIVSENGNYKLGIRCKNTGTEDFMIYKVTNIDKTAPEFKNGGSIYVSEDTGTFVDTTKNGMPYYYSGGTVKISQPSGATDDGSGVAGYEIYVNGQIFNDNILSGDGKYEIKLAASDRSDNKSDLVTTAYVIISTAKPTCEFPRCNNINACNSAQLISGPYITYGNNGYTITTTNFNPPISINFKFNCTYEYYEGNEDIFETTSISRDKFYMMEQTGDRNRIDVNSVVNNVAETVTTCNNGKCTKTNSYTVNISSYGVYNTTLFYLKENSLCDRVGNCNLWQVGSMDLWPQ